MATKKELQVKARDLGIEVRSRDTKADLERKIAEAKGSGSGSNGGRPAQALALRREGLSYAEIADRLGYAIGQSARTAVLGALRHECGGDEQAAAEAAAALTVNAREMRKAARAEDDDDADE